MKSLTIKILVAVSFVLMVLFNFLANALPINGVTTGEVSDAYPNLLVPAGITFSIWGIIYLLLGAFVLYQFGVFGSLDNKKEDLLVKVNKYFIISSVANILWIFSWHYGLIALSVVFMLTILVSLILVADLFRKDRIRGRTLKGKDYFLLEFPFSVYFGWITFATIANITVFLLSVGWDGFGMSDQLWAIIVLLFGAIISILVSLRNKDIAYLLVLIWAYSGIVMVHVSVDGFDNFYSELVAIAVFCITLFVLVIGFTLKKHFTVKSRL
jgi:hypothetical protein